jgi:PRTRC genetic system protein F
MYRCTEAALHELTGENGCKDATPATNKRDPRDPLALPRRFNVPGSYVKNPASNAPLGSLALTLYEDGFITESDSHKDLHDLVKDGFERVRESDLGPVSFVASFDLIVSSKLDRLDECLDTGDVATTDPYWFALELDGRLEPCNGGRRLLELESTVPGLGETSLFAVEMAGARTTGCWSPGFARDVASYLFWRGATTQKEFLEEMDANEEDEEGFELTPAQYDQAFKFDWACSSSRALDAFGLLHALDHPDTTVGDVAEKVCEVLTLIDQGAGFPCAGITELESVYRGCFICWDPDDPVGRVLDDYLEYANQGSDGFTTLCSVWNVSTTREAFGEWLKSYRQGLKLYRALDQLLSLLDTRPTGETDDSVNQS